MSALSLFTAPELTDVGPEQVTAQTVYFCVRFPSKYRYYFVFTQNDDVPILMEHPFRVYYPQTITVSWDTLEGGGGINLDMGAIPGFAPFGDITARIHITEEIYNEIVAAFSGSVVLAETFATGDLVTATEVNFVASEILNQFQFLLDVTTSGMYELDPPVIGATSGAIEFILISTLEGSQYKIDLSHAFPISPESPITVKTLTWQEVLFTTMSVPGYDFYYIPDGDLAMTFIDLKFCFLRQWIPWPPGWVAAIKKFSETP